MNKWEGKFGRDYTLRNLFDIEELDKLYLNNYGITRTKLNKKFLDNLSRSIKILEVGCNIGVQLMFLKKMGFKNLYGIEINREAIEKSKITNIIQSSALDIPFKNDYFDLVFTSGLLIHISPSDIKLAMNEIRRCTKRYIFGFEYYSDNYTEVIYKGKRNMLWKTNFSKLYLEFKDLKLIKEKKLRHSGNIDVIFLLKKDGKRKSKL